MRHTLTFSLFFALASQFMLAGCASSGTKTSETAPTTVASSCEVTGSTIGSNMLHHRCKQVTPSDTNNASAPEASKSN